MVQVHRSRYKVFAGGFFFLGGLFILTFAKADNLFRLVVALGFCLFCLMIGGWTLYSAWRFRFIIGTNGLTVRAKRINRLVPWAEIHSLVLDQEVPVVSTRHHTTPRLLLVPAAESFDARLDLSSPVDGRPCLELFVFNETKESAEQVAEALTRFGGSRFVDARKLVQQRFAAPEFAVGLRGYDRESVDELIARGQQALLEENALRRFGTKAQFDSDAAKLPVALRGYDRRQVDAFLTKLSAEIAAWTEPTEPG